LNDSEETTYGADAWITDPNRVDTDGDTWSDGFEINTKATNPLNVDTDQDGARDDMDLDPHRNLLVAVSVNQIHHGADPWCSPELAAVIRVNGDYTWVTKHETAGLDSFTSYLCPFPDPTTRYSTANFDYTYYSDVPDDQPSVSLQASAWAINPLGDQELVDQSFAYALNTELPPQTLWGGNSWLSISISTCALPKAKALLITDGNATVTAADGEHRLAGQDRYFVFTFDVTSSFGPFVDGVNSIVVPRSVFLESRLRKEFDAGDYGALTDATLYGEDLGKSDVSEGVAGIIAKSLSGSAANEVLDRLLRNSTNAIVNTYVDITPYAVLTNLPSDVVRLLPWAGIASGPTGAEPADFWHKIGAVVSTVVNGLVFVGQLVYKGLVALATFLVNLGEAVVEWGMRVLGEMQSAASTLVQAATRLLQKLVEAIVNAVLSAIHVLLDTIIQPIVNMIEEVKQNLVLAVRSLSVATTADAFATALGSILFGSQLFFGLMLLTVGISVAEKATMVGSGGIGAFLMNTLIPLVRDLLITAIVGLVVVKVLNTTLPSGEAQVTSLVPSQFEIAGKLSFGFAKFFEKLGLYYAAETRGFKSLPAVEKGFLYSFVAFLILLFGLALDNLPDRQAGKAGKILLDGVAIYMVFFVGTPSLGRAKGPLTRGYPLMFPVAEALGLVAMFSSIATLIGDVAVLGHLTGYW
jgi:hypothetical protein